MLSILKLLNKKKKKFFISIVQVIGILPSFYFFIHILNFLPFTKRQIWICLKRVYKNRHVEIFNLVRLYLSFNVFCIMRFLNTI